MNKAIVSLGTLSVLATSAMAASLVDEFGDLSCVTMMKDFGCELQWDLGESDKSIFKAQQWNAEDRKWQDLDEVPSYSPSGVRSGVVQPGRIYRVQACDDNGCVSSSTIWSPDWTAPIDMPDSVTVDIPDNSMTLSVSKTRVDGSPHPVRSVTTQYNMYLVLKQASAFYKSEAEMPPMSAPVMSEVAPIAIDEMIQFNVYKNYQNVRSSISDTQAAN